jgi:hypothetical protein
MFQRAATVVLLTAFASVALAGCAGDSPDTAPVDPSEIDPEQLQAGKGAIAGLLIDDRFRPIQLIDSPTTEFQARGFVLLQETGQESRTTANGEFAFIDLEPGTYTLRVSATGHEAVPSKVVVREGEFAEASIVARRTSSQGSTIVTEEYSAFSPCFINFVALSTTADCTLDQSGETFRAGITGRNVSNLADVT